MRSGIPSYEDALLNADGSVVAELTTHPRRRWTARELLKLVASTRVPPDTAFEYSSTNYVLLGLIIEQVRDRPLVDVLRGGVLKGAGLERLILQPAEAPTAPMAMPDGGSMTAVERGGGYLPSMAEASTGDAAYGMASDAPSLARWWRAFCAGQIVSQASLTEMSRFPDRNRYGLGLFDIAAGYGRSVGHAGWQTGYVAWAGCMLDNGSVIVVLSNRVFDDIGGMAVPLVRAARAN
jgi:D-alanyl-D-alanine carboxypeptidase